MAFTQEQYAILSAAIAQGVTSVKYGDKEITYRSLDDMLKLQNKIAGELGIERPRTKTYISHSKGLK